MKQRSVVLLFVFLFWTIFFVVARGIFLLYFTDARAGLSFSEIISVFEHGVRMDFSMSAYLTAFTGLVLGFLYFKTGIQLWPFWIVIHTVAIVAASLVVVYDLALYPVWQYRLDVRALTEINFQTLAHDSKELIMLIIIFLGLVGC